jgi:hypothetical protein
LESGSSADHSKDRIETALGPLTRDSQGWHGSLSLPDRALGLRLRPGGGVHLDALMDLVPRSPEQLEDHAEKAKRYAFAAEPRVPPSNLTLEGVEVFVPDSEWLRRHQLPSKPMLTLTFGIAEDRNVLDVTFHGSEPVALEYH